MLNHSLEKTLLLLRTLYNVSIAIQQTLEQHAHKKASSCFTKGTTKGKVSFTICIVELETANDGYLHGTNSYIIPQYSTYLY